MSDKVSSIAEDEDDARNDYRKCLHWPDRANCLQDIETHLYSSARLARALWEMANNPEFCEDERSRCALVELSHCVADHSSAALYLLYSGGVVSRSFFDVHVEKARQEGFQAGVRAKAAKTRELQQDAQTSSAPAFAE